MCIIAAVGICLTLITSANVDGANFSNNSVPSAGMACVTFIIVDITRCAPSHSVGTTYYDLVH